MEEGEGRKGGRREGGRRNLIHSHSASPPVGLSGRARARVRVVCASSGDGLGLGRGARGDGEATGLMAAARRITLCFDLLIHSTYIIGFFKCAQKSAANYA